MHLVLDVGNSSIKAGLIEAGQLVRTIRVETAGGEAPAQTVQRLLGEMSTPAIDRVGLTSVVPALTETLCSTFQDEQGWPTLVVDHHLALPFDLRYETPHTLGTDRLAAAAAAWTQFGRDAGGALRSVVAVDAGTAITYEVVTRTGAYLGGAIGAGPGLLRHAMRAGTAQLPAVEPTLPGRAVGRSTREAIQAGLMFGFVDSVAGMLRRIAGEVQDTPFVVATGGWSPLLARHLAEIDHVEPHLVLHGIDVLMRLNPEAPSSGRARR